jgi:hypothetical protein
VNLVKFNFRAAALHGDKVQSERDKIFSDFKQAKVQVCREREKERDRDRDRETERQRDRETERQRDRETERGT